MQCVGWKEEGWFTVSVRRFSNGFVEAACVNGCAAIAVEDLN